METELTSNGTKQLNEQVGLTELLVTFRFRFI